MLRQKRLLSKLNSLKKSTAYPPQHFISGSKTRSETSAKVKGNSTAKKSAKKVGVKKREQRPKSTHSQTTTQTPSTDLLITAKGTFVRSGSHFWKRIQPPKVTTHSSADMNPQTSAKMREGRRIVGELQGLEQRCIDYQKSAMTLKKKLSADLNKGEFSGLEEMFKKAQDLFDIFLNIQDSTHVPSTLPDDVASDVDSDSADIMTEIMTGHDLNADIEDSPTDIIEEPITVDPPTQATQANVDAPVVLPANNDSTALDDSRAGTSTETRPVFSAPTSPPKRRQSPPKRRKPKQKAYTSQSHCSSTSSSVSSDSSSDEEPLPENARPYELPTELLSPLIHSRKSSETSTNERTKSSPAKKSRGSHTTAHSGSKKHDSRKKSGKESSAEETPKKSKKKKLKSVVAPIASTSRAPPPTNPDPIQVVFNERQSKIFQRKSITTYPIWDRYNRKTGNNIRRPQMNHCREDHRVSSDFRRRHHAGDKPLSMPRFDGAQLSHEEHRQSNGVRAEVPLTTHIQPVPPTQEVEAPASEEIAAMPPLEVPLLVNPPPNTVQVERVLCPAPVLPLDPRVPERSPTPVIPLERVTEAPALDMEAIIANATAIAVAQAMRQLAPIATIKLDNQAGPSSASQ